MVRVILQDASSTVKVPDDSGAALVGPLEFVADGFAYDLGASWAVHESGEWVVTATGLQQTLPEVREVYFVVWFLIPLVIILGFRSVIRSMIW